MNGGGGGDDDDSDDALGAFAPFLSRVLSWDYYKIYAESMSGYQNTSSSATKKTKSSASSSSSSVLKPIPLRFSNAKEYVECFSSFLVEEAKAIVLKGDGSGGASVACEKCERVRVVSPSSPKGGDEKGSNTNASFCTPPSLRSATQQQCEQFSENDVLFLSKLNSVSEDEKIEKGADYCFAFCEGKVSDTEVKVRLFSPLTMGSVDGDSPQPPSQHRRRMDRRKNLGNNNNNNNNNINNNYDASNEDKERLANVRAKLWSNGQSWHLTRVCNMSTVRREWMAVQEVSSIPFADLVLDARNNNDITTSNTTTAKKQKKERQKSAIST